MVGAPGSFVVTVEGKVVAEKTPAGFPTDDEVVNAVRKAMNGTA
jgi:hypothetical protein